MVNMRREVTVVEQGLLLGRRVSTHDRMITIGIGSFSIINTTVFLAATVDIFPLLWAMSPSKNDLIGSESVSWAAQMLKNSVSSPLISTVIRCRVVPIVGSASQLIPECQSLPKVRVIMASE